MLISAFAYVRPMMFIAVLMCMACPRSALCQGASQAGVLRVAIKEAPPFVIRNADGGYDGISIRLWHDIASSLDLDYEFSEASLDTILDQTASGDVDLAVAALTITAERETRVDFSHPYYAAGLVAAVRNSSKPGLWASIHGLFSGDALRVIVMLAVLLVCVGVTIWIVERRHNPDSFGGNWLEGLGSAIWWSTVTVTTVGYGDKVPRTSFGRFVGVVWMLAGIMVFASFTAAITSALTVNNLSSILSDPSDLSQYRTSAISDTKGEVYLRDLGLHPATCASLDEGLKALSEGRFDVLVHDEPLLRYAILRDYPGTLDIVPLALSRDHYGFAFPPGSPLCENVNREILEITSRTDWQECLRRFLGDEA